MSYRWPPGVPGECDASLGEIACGSGCRPVTGPREIPGSRRAPILQAAPHERTSRPDAAPEPVGHLRPGARAAVSGPCAIAAVRLLLAGTRAAHTTAPVSVHDLPKIGRTVSRMYRSLFLM